MHETRRVISSGKHTIRDTRTECTAHKFVAVEYTCPPIGVCVEAMHQRLKERVTHRRRAARQCAYMGYGVRFLSF